MAKIGFIGLGNMGGPMAANLVKAGHQVRGFDLNPAALAALEAAGGTRAGSAAEAAQGAEAIVTMLPAGEHVREVWMHQGGLIEAAVAQGQPLLIDCSTIDVASARTVAEAAAAAGLAMLDAPVSGGTVGAAAGTLTFMVGGTEEAFARARPVLAAMGKTIVHAGAPGAGQAAKICNNMMLSINMIGVSEGFLLAQKLGLDWDKLWAITSTATAQSWALSNYCPAPGPVPNAPSNRDYAPGFMAALMLKDVKLAQAAADATGSPTPLATLATALYQKLVDAGEGARDFSAIFRWLAEQERGKLG
ncbi:MAG: 3-hydroxyisobutyrate dehydrogenase [Rhodospirillales bacterium]|jgi:3-hydroxyisobutyrate dehydrogenase|nr:3-hydroxyisobutyrate dehydrogenase [Rhodospirillales bacterium]